MCFYVVRWNGTSKPPAHVWGMSRLLDRSGNLTIRCHFGSSLGRWCGRFPRRKRNPFVIFFIAPRLLDRSGNRTIRCHFGSSFERGCGRLPRRKRNPFVIFFIAPPLPHSGVSGEDPAGHSVGKPKGFGPVPARILGVKIFVFLFCSMEWHF